MKNLKHIFLALACVLSLANCSDEEIIKSGNQIRLTTPDIQISDMPSEAISRAVGDNVDWATEVTSATLYLDLLEDDGTTVDRSTKFTYNSSGNPKWTAADPVTIIGKPGDYKARMAIEVDRNETKFYASYNGTIAVAADGKFTPGASLTINTSRVNVVLLDTGGTEIQDNTYTVEYADLKGAELSVTNEAVYWAGSPITPKLIDASETLSTNPNGAHDNIIPETIAQNTQLFTVKKSGKDLAKVYYKSSGLTLEAAKSYSFTIKLNGTKEIILTDANITKPEWSEENNMPIDIKTKGLTELAYNPTTNTYTVKGPYGLAYLQQWMNRGEEEQPGTQNENVPLTDRMALNIELDDNIDMSVLSPDQSTSDDGMYKAGIWKPIGDNTTPYTGTFDGQGKVISNLSVVSTGAAGLIGTLGSLGVVEGVIINSGISVNAGSNVAGSLVGVNNGTVIACAVQVAANTTGTTTGALVGTNNGSVISCYAVGETLVGGGTGPVAYSYHSANNNGATNNSSSVVSTWKNGEVYPIVVDMNRGIAEYNNYKTDANEVKYADSWGDSNNMPLLSGNIAKWHVEEYKDHYKEPLPGNAPPTGDFVIKGDDSSNTDEYGKVTGYEAKTQAGIEAWYADVTGGEDQNGDDNDGDLHLDLYLTGDVDGSNIGQVGDAVAPYVGTINGNGYTINNLEIRNASDATRTGFVGELGTQGVVENLIVDAEIDGGRNMGAIVGYNNGGRVSNCETTATTVVTNINEDLKGATMLGGVVGYNIEGIVENCINRATVIGGKGMYVGGVAGENYRKDNCIIRNCINYGDVTGYENVGGVVGINHRVVHSCHNEGSVTGVVGVGGVIGMSNDASPYIAKNDDSTIPGFPIYVINCTNEGNVQGQNSVGGIIGASGSENSCGGYIVACWNSGNIEASLTDNTIITGSSELKYPLGYIGGVVGWAHHYERVFNSDTHQASGANCLDKVGNRTSRVIACYSKGTITAAGAANTDTDNDGVGLRDASSVVVDSYTENGSPNMQNMNNSINNYKDGILGTVESPTINSNITRLVNPFNDLAALPHWYTLIE